MKKEQRIRLIAFKIYEDYMIRLKGTNLNAMLATYSKIDAIRYWEHFNQLGDINTAVVISPPDTREGHTCIDEETTEKELHFWNKMMDKYGITQILAEDKGKYSGVVHIHNLTKEGII